MPQLSAKTKRFFPIPGDPDGTKLEILHLKAGEIERISSETTEWTGKQGANEAFVTELKFNPTIQNRSLRIASVVGWKGFTGVDGERLECSKANVSLFLDEDPILGEGEDAKKLSEWIDDFRAQLAKELAPQEEEAPKN